MWFWEHQFVFGFNFKFVVVVSFTLVVDLHFVKVPIVRISCSVIVVVGLVNLYFGWPSYCFSWHFS